MYSKRISSTGTALAGALLLFAFNAVIVSRLFGLEWGTHLGSVEGAYIALGKYFAAHGYSFSWFPFWYCGEPTQNTYPPLLMWITAAVKVISGWSAPRAYHFVSGLEYAVGPAAAFLLAWALSRKLFASFAGGVLYSIFNFSSFFLREVRSDVGGRFLSRRLQVLEPYGEGPHILTLILLPIAVLLLHRALTRNRRADYAIAIFGFAAVLFSNVMGVLATLLGVYAYLVTRDQIKLFDWVKSAFLAVVAYAIVTLWIPPSLTAVISERARLVGGDYTWAYQVAPLVFPMIFATALVIAYVLKRLNVESAVAFFIVAFFLFGILALPAYWRHIDFVPMPKRYHVELDMLFPFIVTLSLAALPWKQWPAFAPKVAAGVLVLLAAANFGPLRRQARDLLQPLDITKTSEYKMSQEFARRGTAARVLAPGDVGIWMNDFFEIPQWDGGFVQAIPNDNQGAGGYLLQSNAGNELNLPASIAWLKAFGVARVGVTGPRSTEVYKPFENPNKFKGVLTESWRDGDDAIFEVPLHSTGLVHVVPAAAMPVHPPENGLDTKEMLVYINALEHEAREPKVEWLAPGSARIQAHVNPGDVVSAQISFVHGWHAASGGETLAVKADGLGQLQIIPTHAGDLDITLEYDGGWERILTRVISLGAISGTVLLGLSGLWNYKSGFRPA